MKTLTCCMLIAVWLSGCATKTYLHVQTDPPGARIVERDTNRDWGRAPVTLWYPTKHKQGECLTVFGLAAQWPSGTVAQSEMNLDLCPVDEEHTLLLRHPGGDGYAFDFQAGMQYQQLALERERNAALERNARANLYQVFQEWIPRTSRSSTGETTTTSPW